MVLEQHFDFLTQRRPKNSFSTCSILMLLTFNIIFEATEMNEMKTNDKICQNCNLMARKKVNTTFDEAFERYLPRSDNYSITLADLRPGVCEATFLIRDGKLYVHKLSRSYLQHIGKNTVYLRHSEFLFPLLENVKKTEELLQVKLPTLLFNLETQDNPTCKYPLSEISSGDINVVKGIFHHSYCSPKLCDGIILLPISYNQNFLAMEATKKLDLKASRIPWELKDEKLFWRGSNAGKMHEYKFFDWELSKLPRAKAVEMCKFRKDTDVKFGFVPWQKFMKHKYTLALAGNTYSSLFKHALRSGSCILRQEERMYEWFEPFLKEWVHYIPIKWDLSDLFTQLHWAKSHDNEAKDISKRASTLGTELFSPQFMACYIYTILQRFHTYLDIDFNEKSYENFIEIRTVCNSKPGKKNMCQNIPRKF